ncbi:glycoside hydrolase family 43 protein [Sphingomonas piscis]|uniref:glycoside hydrolase family 43 protein n=1 Tax=Sphingomonas piscis TaxID=2714943 RepID=UPI001FE9BBAF|nr:glycoside hydrolase family 43 protein [Sphingomonas piscis]
MAAPAVFDWFEYQGNDPLPQAGAGEFNNPILTGFYPDPSITRVGDDYYIVTSTFSYFPGLPIWHSRDLVSWKQIGNAISRPTQLDFKKLGLSRGVFAPTIEHRNGTFYIANTCVDCGGNFVITAKNPAGPWSDPIWQPEVDGIDPSIFFDDDGRAWMLNNGAPTEKPRYEGHRAIWIQEFDVRTNKTFGPRTLLVNGGVDISKKPIWIEGPNIYKKDGWYYLSAAEGGTAEGHSQVALRSKNVTGPYTPWEGNPYLTQRDLPRDRKSPITSAGHADLVQLPDGSWWASFLAVRPYEGDFYNTGRETFLMPVSWAEGWPRITRPGETIPYVLKRPNLRPSGTAANGRRERVREEFNGQALPLDWMMMRNPRERWYSLSGGALQLTPRPVGLGDFANPSMVGRRQQHMYATASTSVRFNPAASGDKAGLTALQNDEYWYLLSVARGSAGPEVRLERRAGPNDPASGTVLASAPLSTGAGTPVQLRIRARGGAYDFEYAIRGGRWQTLAANQDGKILSTKTAGGFVGTVFGLYAYSPGKTAKVPGERG